MRQGWRGMVVGCLLAAGMACGGTMPGPSTPPAPEVPAPSPPPPEPFDALAWWKALPPCVQKELMQTTKAPAPTDAAGVAPMTAVTRLRIYPTCEPKVESIEWIRPLVQLEDLMINDQPVGDLGPLGALVRLHDLEVRDWQLPGWPRELTLPELRTLSILAPLPDLSFLGRHPKLVKLRIERASKASLEPLRSLAHLEELTLENMNTADLEPLSGMTGLKVLRLYSLDFPPADLAPLASLTGLQELVVADSGGVPPTDLAPLVGLRLTKLTLQHRGLRSVEVLTRMSALRELDLSETDLASLAPLEELPLTSLTLRGTGVTGEEIAAFRAAHPDVALDDEPLGD